MKPAGQPLAEDVMCVHNVLASKDNPTHTTYDALALV